MREQGEAMKSTTLRNYHFACPCYCASLIVMVLLDELLVESSQARIAKK